MGPNDKYELLLGRLRETESLLVAFSGGVDSTLLAFAAHAVLGPRCLAVLATSDTYPAREVAYARQVAARLGLNLLEVETHELTDPSFAENTPERCYHCKTELFGLLSQVASAHNMRHVADGSNLDDLDDHRPGSRAAADHGVISPLRDAQMTKQDIRDIARMLDLPNWDKPSMACLASRFPYGERITEERLAAVACAEEALGDMGLSQFRVRAHGDVARVEVEPESMEQAFEMREDIAAAIKSCGFTYVAQDLEGYRSGSLNEVLDLEG